MIRKFCFAVLSALLYAFNCCHAQVTPSTETALGSSPYAVYNGGNIDSINPINGNVFLHIPLLSYPQRGHALRLAFNIYYNDKRWYIENFQQNANTGQVQGSWTYYSGGTPTSNVGVYVARDQHVEFGEDIVGTQYFGGESYDPYVVTDTTNGFWVREPDGAQHYYGDSASQSCSGSNCPVTSSSYGITYPTSDGSGFLSNNSGSLTPTAITGRDGVTYSVSSTSSSSKNYETLTDKSGNSIAVSASGWTDTTGRAIPGSYASPGTSDGIDPSAGGEYGIDPIPGVPVAVPSQCSGANTARQWIVPEPSGNTEPYYLCYTNTSFKTAFDIDATTGSTIYGQVTEASGTAPNLLTAIVLPNGTAYRFTYDTQYLSLVSITLPTGGTISYVWQNLSVSGKTTGLGTIPVTRALKTRTVSAGSGQPSGTWTYQRYYNPNYGSTSANNPDFWSVVTDPNGNDVEEAVGGTDSNGNVYYGQPETARSVYTGCSPHDTASNRSCSGSGTLLQQHQYVLQAYGGITDGGGPWTVPDLYRQSTDTMGTPTANGTLTSQTSYTYVPNYGFCTTYSFNSTSTPVTDSHSSCFTTNQIASVAKYDYGSAGSGAAGSLLSTRTTSYNWQSMSSYQSANLLDLVKSEVVTDGSGNRAGESDYGYDESGSPQGAIGNQTSITSWLNTGTSPVSGVTYNSQGMPTLTKDPLGYETQLSYQCSGSLLNSIVSPYNSSTTISETTSYGYDCNSGALNSVTDPNSTVTMYTYDGLSRLVSKTVTDSSNAQLAASAVNFNGDPSPPHVTTTTTTAVSTAAGNVSGSTTSPNSQAGTSTAPVVSDTYYDGVERVVKAVATSDPGGASTVVTDYDALGRVQSVSNPYRSGSSVSTTYTYDALGRVIFQTQQDGSVLGRCYNGLATSTQPTCRSLYGGVNGSFIDLSDELGNTSQQVYDAASRLTTVFEGDLSAVSCGDLHCPPRGEPQTNYSYDALNNLTKIDQFGGSASTSSDRIRTFSYDSLSRLLASNNPEKYSANYPAGLTCTGASTGPWTECYGYDANSNTTFHEDNRGITTILAYDGLNRVLSKTYNDGTPTAYFGYDTATFSWASGHSPLTPTSTPVHLIGRLATEGTAGNSSAAAYSYDGLGRLLLKEVCSPRTCAGSSYVSMAAPYDMHYAYDKAGNLTFSGRGLLASLDAATPNTGYYYGGLALSYSGTSQTTSAVSDLPTDATHPTKSVATNITYAPTGGIASLTVGNTFGQTSTYTSRGWLQNRNTTDYNGNQTLMDTFNRDSHGNVQSISDTIAGTYQYCYDNFNRLTIATQVTSTAYTCAAPSSYLPNTPSNGVGYQYDGFGNLTARTAYSGSTYQVSFTPSISNQIPGASYDAAGDLLNDGVHTYTYDAEGRISQVVDQQTQYYYDAEGRRIATGAVGQAPATDFLYDLSGRLVTIVGTNFKMVRTSLYVAGQHWGEYTQGTGSGGGITEYRLGDEVGTMVYNDDENGNVVEGCGSWPFGEQLTCTPSVDYTETHYADQKRDQESNLDYMGARFYSSTLGRFMSPDPSGLAYADIRNPQSLNLYSYAQNNPLTNTDPTGMECVWDDGSFDAADDKQTGNAAGCSSQGGTYVNPNLFENAQLTNGQQSNTNYGDWSSKADPTLAQSWVDPSSTTTGMPIQNDTFTMNMSQTAFISGMQQSNFYLSNMDQALADRHLSAHNGIQMRQDKEGCNLHVNIDRNSGQNGKPVTGDFHYDVLNPNPNSNPADSLITAPLHTAEAAIDIGLTKAGVSGTVGDRACASH